MYILEREKKSAGRTVYDRKGKPVIEKVKVWQIGDMQMRKSIFSDTSTYGVLVKYPVKLQNRSHKEGCSPRVATPKGERK